MMNFTEKESDEIVQDGLIMGKTFILTASTNEDARTSCRNLFVLQMASIYALGAILYNQKMNTDETIPSLLEKTTEDIMKIVETFEEGVKDGTITERKLKF